MSRTRAAIGLLLIAVITTGCAGTNVARTREPVVTPSPVAHEPDGPLRQRHSPKAASARSPSAAPEAARPDPTPIIAKGLAAPALDDLVAGGTPFDLAVAPGPPDLPVLRLHPLPGRLSRDHR